MICDHADQIDIRELGKEVDFIPDVFDFQGERIRTLWTDANFGGRRQWFRCPNCGRRCAIIYRRGSGPLWGCRICLDGRYASETMSPRQRAIRKAIKIRKRLGQNEGGTLAPFPEKPKGMHWKTYWAIRLEAQERERELLLRDLAHIKRKSVDEIKAELGLSGC